MFLPKQTPPPKKEANGLDFRLKLSEKTLAKILPWFLSVLLGTGVLGYVQSQTPSFSDPMPPETKEEEYRQ